MSARKNELVLQHRTGSLLVISKPQKTEYEPSATNVSLVDPAPSMIARSPGYCRTTIGAAYHPACVPGAGGAVTVIAEEPLLPPVAAVMVAEPMVTPDTKPLLLTVATVVALLDHVIERPDKVLPAESFGVAVSCTVFPV